nr:class II heat shock protein [Tanacetum cinerariifolium]
MMAEYQNEFEMLIKRVTRMLEKLLKSFYIFGLKLALQIELLRARPTTLREAFSLARIIEARFEAIAKKEKETDLTSPDMVVAEDLGDKSKKIVGDEHIKGMKLVKYVEDKTSDTKVAGDGVTSIKRRRRDQSSDDVKIMATTSRRSRLKEDLGGSITTWEDFTTRFLAQFFPPGRTVKLQNDILMFQQHQGESVSEACTHFKDLLQKFLIMALIVGFKSKFFMIMSHFILSARLTVPSEEKFAIRTPTNLGKSLRTSPSSTLRAGMRKRIRQTAHIERMERFENAIFKQRDEINDRMVEMFRLLKELTTRKAPEKVIIRKEVKSPVTKNVNYISLTRGEEERNYDNDIVTGDDIKKLSKQKQSWFNDSLSGTRVGKIKRRTYNLFPKGPVYEAILRKKISRKENIEGNFEIPCNIGGLKTMNALVDQGSGVNVMPLSTYMKLTDERPTETDIRLSLASHSYIYPLGITKDIKSKISFHRIPESLCKDEKGIKNDIKPIASTMTVIRIVLEWEEKIKLHQEKEMEFDR